MEQSGQAKSLTGQVLVRDLATALDGHGGIKNITLNSDYTLNFTLADDTEVTTTSVRGATGAKGDKGTDGRAITSVTKTGTSGLVDTYKIQFSDNTSTTFTVTNGASIKSVAKTGTSGLVDTYTVRLTDNTTSTFTVTNGNGIASIALQSGTHAAGTTDVYKITFDNGQYTTFSVYNGLNGSGSVATVNDKLPDASGNVSLAAIDVGAPTVEELNTLETTVGGKQPTTNSLGTETDLADGDFIPFYDTSASANKKTLWSNIVAKIRTALFGSANGFLKANGSGVVSAVSTIPVASGGTGATTAAAARANLGALSSADGAVTRAKLAQDALYSPIRMVQSDSNVASSDVGATIRTGGSASAITVTLTQAVSHAMPIGAEIAFLPWVAATMKIAFDGVKVGVLDQTQAYSSPTFTLKHKGMIAIKKILSDNSGDYWLLSGLTEEVTT